MSSYYIPLPAAEYPRNALLDFSPIRQAAQDWRQADQDAYERKRQEMADQRASANQAYERKRNALADARSAEEWNWKKEDRNLPQTIELNNSLVEYDKRTRQVRPLYTAPDPLDSFISGLTNGNQSSQERSNEQPTYQPQSFNTETPEITSPFFSRVNDNYITSSPNNFTSFSSSPTAPVVPVNSQQFSSTKNAPINSQPSTNLQQSTTQQPAIDWNKIDDVTALRMMKDPRYKELGKMAIEQRMKNSSGGLSKETLNAVQKDMIDASEGLVRIKGIRETYNKEFTYWQNRLKYFGYDVSAKMGYPLTPDQEKEYAQMTVWQRKTIENLNSKIKEVTGAAMAVSEVPRIAATVPNTNDNYVQFEAKMNDVERTLRLAMMRYRYYMNKGFFANGGNKEMMAADMSIDQFKDMLNDRKAAIADELKMKNPQIDENSLKLQVGKKLRQEFGAQDI